MDVAALSGLRVMTPRLTLSSQDARPAPRRQDRPRELALAGQVQISGLAGCLALFVVAQPIERNAAASD
jgi:hypothetical protein